MEDRVEAIVEQLHKDYPLSIPRTSTKHIRRVVKGILTDDEATNSISQANAVCELMGLPKRDYRKEIAEIFEKIK